ncbi:receptor-like serine/threonine-protein kinase NCRK [Triticum aestivum]|uniref:receptor-like serine/threonine-protein kinase NCRK n=1 Tax=Triticum aestivum TaxID=4565 RepID=UPI001D0151E6|nr:receptor-like serine/threonine-protein kinase NCRK [Triticum aestivum]
MHSFDKYASWNSRSNLVSHRSSPLTQLKPKPGLSVIKGFLCSCPLVSRSEDGPFPGVVLRFSYAELDQATGKFSDEQLIGVGGTSKVYRGQLADGKVVAVKKLRPLGGADEDYEFLSEIELLSRLNHCHVVPLLGYCSERQGRQLERLLVFECMTNGNLRECLDDLNRKPMDWATRVGVALGAARGLEYLHEAAAPRILHQDIKSTNGRELGDGAFPPEEMQIMAHLARECLQWDPEARPTMTKVVQILSTIAPLADKRRRHHLPAAAGAFAPGFHAERPRECSVWQDDDDYGHRRDHLHGGYGSNAKGAVLSGEVTVNVGMPVTMMTTMGRSWRSAEQEEVDLTEPRLETFTEPTTTASPFR